MIRGDSTEYNLLEKWISKMATPAEMWDNQEGATGEIAPDWKPISVEIGVREGLGSKTIMDSFRKLFHGKHKDKITKQYKHIGIDPYGNLKYQHYDTSPAYTADYTEEMRLQLEKDFLIYPEFKLYHMTDIEFMKRYPDLNNVSLVHFDGPHKTADVIAEAVWFAQRATYGARFIFDDYPKYNMQLISDCLKQFGFKVLEQGENKICLTMEKE